jgi:hypothetical protein
MQHNFQPVFYAVGISQHSFAFMIKNEKGYTGWKKIKYNSIAFRRLVPLFFGVNYDCTTFIHLDNGVVSNLYGPAVLLYSNKGFLQSTHYYLNGSLHRYDGPAHQSHVSNRNTYAIKGRIMAERKFLHLAAKHINPDFFEKYPDMKCHATKHMAKRFGFDHEIDAQAVGII